MKLQWPNTEVLKTYAAWYCAVGIMFCLVYGFGARYSLATTSIYNFAFGWEQQIPLIPEAIWIYFSIFMLFVLPPFVMDPNGIRRLGISLCCAIFIAGLIFFLFPAPVIWRSSQSELSLDTLLGRLHQRDVRANSLPSLHVVFSTLIVCFVAQRASWMKIFLYSWLALICVSVLLVHQHHLLDVVAGLALSLVLFLKFRARENLALQ